MMAMAARDIGSGRKAHSAAVHLIVFALIVATPLLLLVGVLLYRSVTLESERVSQRIEQVLEALISDIDRDTDRRIAVLETLSTSTFLATEDWPAFYAQVKGSLRGRAYLVLVDAEGRQLINTFVPYGEAPALTGDPETVQRMRRTARPVVSDLFTSLVVKQPVYNISIPVLRGNEVRFVMSLGLVPEDLRTLLQSQSLPAGWTAAIWDSKGIIMARLRDQARLVGTAVPPRLGELPPGRAVRTLNIDGEKVLAAVGRGQWSDWTIEVAFPAALVDKQLKDSLLFWGATLLLVGGLVIGLAFLFGRGLTRPLAAATAAAGALGRGEPFVIGKSRVGEVNAVNDALRRARRDIEEGSAALRRSEAQLRTAAEAAQFGVHEYDVAHDRTLRSPQFLKILGAGEADAAATFEAGLDFVHPDDREATRRRKQEILGGAEGQYQLEYRIRRRDGQVRWVMDRGQVIHDTEGKAMRVVGVVLDITDIKEAEQRQHLLFDELNHRVKNTLSIVQALAQQTLRTRPDPADFARAFADRLGSLARAHSLLTHESWRGAALRDIVATALAAFLDEGRPIEIGGDAVMVPASTTITLGLMLHELATNAAKYGALSVADGRLSIQWTTTEVGAGTAVDLHWREDSGPPVSPPKSRGFGSRLLAGGAQQLGAELELDYAAAGLRCRLRFQVPQL
ncbi:MAG: PAS domain-containing protein [Rhodospirillales bacterium]|nr:PAS domain-containing protein [Rhodospirillales bacterium]